MRALSPHFRPQIIEGGYRRNPDDQPIRAGWPWASERWRIWQIDDGVLTWHHGSEQHRCTAGTWVIQQGDRITSHMEASPGSRWAQLRFACCPSDPHGDPNSWDAWHAPIPNVLLPEQTKHLQPLFADILAWWWRDDWYLVQAEARLSGLLVALARDWRDTELHRAIPEDDDPFRPADRIWVSRPLAPLADLAAACGMSERTFRRQFLRRRNRSPSAYARTLMASQACDLLRERSDWSIKHIAKHLGYQHASTFVRAFRSEVGRTPEQWRKRK